MTATAPTREYVLVEVIHEGEQPQALGEQAGADGAFSYTNRFAAIPAQVALRAAAHYAQTADQRRADRHGDRPAQRGDLYRRVRAGEGALPLGPQRLPRRGRLLLDPGRPGMGRSRLGRHVPAAGGAGGDGRVRRGRSRPAHHRRTCLRRRQHAPVHPSPGEDQEHHQVRFRGRQRLQTKSASKTRAAAKRSSSTPRRISTRPWRTTWRPG